MRATKEQFEAISALEGRHLVSAGAGSGKTAVLSERAKKLIAEGHCKIEELLVLTFTNDAAAEMRARIYRLLKEDPSPLCQKAAGDIGKASIMTFDALCRRIVDEFPFAAGLGEGNTTEVSSLLNLELGMIIHGMLEELAEKEDFRYVGFVSRYCDKHEGPLGGKILEILAKAAQKADPDKWLAEYPDKVFGQDFVNRAKSEVHLNIVDILHTELEAIRDLEDVDFIAKAEVPVEEAIDAFLKGSDEGLSFIAGEDFKLPRAPTGRSDADKELWKTIKGIHDGVKGAWGHYQNKGDFEESILMDEGDIRFLFELAIEARARLNIRKKAAGLYDFADIFGAAMKVLDDPEARKKIGERYKFAMIDEYQDTNDLQVAMIEKIGITNVFMVGDVKQSIYRFRHANPKIFMGEKKKALDGKGTHLVTLPHNFRSRSSVLKPLNDFFSQTMTEGLGGVDYEHGGEKLLYGNHSYDQSENERYGVKVARIDVSSFKGNGLAEWLATDIVRKLNSAFPVYDKNLGRERPCRPGDFAILESAKAAFPVYKRILEGKGVPVDMGTGEPLKEKDEALIMSSLFKYYLLAGEPTSQILRHAYASIRRSYLFEDSDASIYSSLKDNSFLEGEFHKKVLKNRPYFLSCSVLSAFDYMVAVYPFYEGIAKKTHPKEGLSLLASLRGLASSMDRLGYDLLNFAYYIEDLSDADLDEGDAGSKETFDAVKLYSIHKSKGLQFPIVYLPNLEKGFNTQDQRVSSFFSDTYGASLPRDSLPSPLLPLYKRDIEKEATDEEIRKLYVAATRAEELLIFVESDKDAEPDPEKFGKPGKAIRCYRDLLARCNFDRRFFYEKVEEKSEARYEAEETDMDEEFPVEFRHVETKEKPPLLKRPSKESDLNTDPGALSYGETLHRYMELIDFKNIDVSFIPDSSAKKKIEKVLSLPLFSDVKDAEAYQEYAYIDKDGTEGVIDLLLVYKDRLVVVDYKSRDIDDPLYEKQVRAYLRHSEETFGLKGKALLLSLSEARTKVVDYEGGTE